MKQVFALIGNQNSGKSTLFNYLTGGSQHVGNFLGVTVEKKTSALIARKDINLVDLPGIYSLSPYSSEEVVTLNMLLREKPNAIINVIDATNIERSLYLSLQLMELNLPMIIALNMMDELLCSGSFIDTLKIEEKLGIPVVPISVNKGEGVEELVLRTIDIAQKHSLPKRLDFCSGEVHCAIHSVAHLIEPKVRAKGLPLRFSATKLVEGDTALIEELSLTANEQHIISHVVDEMEKILGLDHEAALADMRYSYIEQLCKETVHKQGETIAQTRSVLIDRCLTHKYFAMPIFLLIMFMIFWLTFDVIGGTLRKILDDGIAAVIHYTDSFLTVVGVSAPIHSLIIDGALTGMGSVLSFVPIIIVLYFFLSLLEDTGYMSRTAFVMDKLLRKIGLSGSSFVPMLIGFGCSVPAILSTRTLPSKRDKKMTILLTPFISCSAKLPIYGMFIAAFFQEYQSLVMMVLYATGIFMAVFTGYLLKTFVYTGNPVPFVMELPAYRLPTAKGISLHVWDKARNYVQKVFTVIFAASIIIWLLQNFDLRFNMVKNPNESMLAAIGAIVAPVFAPLGFGDWRAATALVAGLTGKESVISTLAVLAGGTGEGESIALTLTQVFTPLTAFAFLIFTLLYIPCVAALNVMRYELESIRQVCLMMLYQLVVAWIMAFMVYRIGLLFGFQ
ncbi:MAG: ferrous iron transport protein B [Pelosinus sp.]|nr:ferrous iron transport protein B [Pelosinus sp.]